MFNHLGVKKKSKLREKVCQERSAVRLTMMVKTSRGSTPIYARLLLFIARYEETNEATEPVITDKVKVLTEPSDT